MTRKNIWAWSALLFGHILWITLAINGSDPQFRNHAASPQISLELLFSANRVVGNKILIFLSNQINSKADKNINLYRSKEFCFSFVMLEIKRFYTKEVGLKENVRIFANKNKLACILIQLAKGPFFYSFSGKFAGIIKKISIFFCFELIGYLLWRNAILWTLTKLANWTPELA